MSFKVLVVNQGHGVVWLRAVTLTFRREVPEVIQGSECY